MFLRSRQSKARFPGIRRKGQNFLLYTHGRQMGKQPPLWILLTLFSWAYAVTGRVSLPCQETEENFWFHSGLPFLRQCLTPDSMQQQSEVLSAHGEQWSPVGVPSPAQPRHGSALEQWSKGTSGFWEMSPSILTIILIGSISASCFDTPLPCPLILEVFMLQ